jgi:Mrp family chromosome partitioning ATPase
MIDNHPQSGILEYLTSSAGDEPVEINAIKELSTGLDILLCSEPTSLPSDVLLMSGAFERLVQYAKDNYNLTIIDTPPAGYAVDAQVISPLADAMLFVVRWASTNQRHVIRTLRELETYSENPALLVLNSSDVGAGYGYGKAASGYYS